MHSIPLAFFLGWLIAVLGGLIGLGGAEFRLPALIEVFKQRLLQAVVVNLLISLVTVTFSLIFRAGLNGISVILNHIGIVLNLLAGSLLGAYLGAYFATRIHERVLTMVVAGFLLFLSAVLIGHHWVLDLVRLQAAPAVRAGVGVLAGVGIGVFSGVLGVAGGELLIPAIVLIFGTDIKLAGSLSLAVSMPTIVMGLMRYARQKSSSSIVLPVRSLVLPMALGSVFGALTGSFLVRLVSSELLYVLLGSILFVSALRLLRHALPRADQRPH